MARQQELPSVQTDSPDLRILNKMEALHRREIQYALRRPWMLDGKVGQIVKLMAEAAKEVGGSVVLETATVKSKQKGQDYATETKLVYRGAEAIKQAARVLCSKGIITIWETSEEQPRDTLGVTRVTATFIAPDGSYIVHSITGAAYGGQGRQLTIAGTAAVKQIYALALQMASPNEETDKPEPAVMSPTLRAWYDHLCTCTTSDQLRNSISDPSHQALDATEIPRAREMWREQQQVVLDCMGMEKRAYERKKELQEMAEIAERKRARRQQRAMDGDGPDTPINLSKVKPRKKR